MKTGQPLASFGKAETGHDEDISKKHLGQFMFWGEEGRKIIRNYCYWLMTCVVAKWAKKKKNGN